MTERDALQIAYSAMTRMAKGEGWQESEGPRALQSVAAALSAACKGVSTKAALLSAPRASERPATEDVVRWFKGGVIP